MRAGPFENQGDFLINISTYLGNPDSGFVEISEVPSYEGDSFYVEGAMELTVNGVQLIDQSMWDYIDQLWSYLVQLVIKAKASGSAEVLFPDQVIYLNIDRVGECDCLVRSRCGEDKRAARVSVVELSDAVAQAAEHFFDSMISLIPEERKGYEHELRKVEALRHQ